MEPVELNNLGVSPCSIKTKRKILCFKNFNHIAVDWTFWGCFWNGLTFYCESVAECE